MKTSPIDVDAPEVRAVAQLAGIRPDRMIAAYSDPEHFLTHMGLDEIKRVQSAMERLAVLVNVMAASTNAALAALKREKY